MEACLHSRGAALNASEAGILRASVDEGQLRTAVAKAIILPLWGPRGITSWSLLAFLGGRKFCIKNAEILSVGKIAEFARFAGGERRKSPDLISLYERSELLGRGPLRV